MSFRHRPTESAPCGASGCARRGSTSSATPGRTARTPSRCCGRRSTAASTSSSCARSRATPDDRALRADLPPRLRHLRRALHRQRRPRPGGRAAAPTASTSARTTSRSRRPGEIVGPDAIIGLSTHSTEQIDGGAESAVDYISVGPVWETPTKAGRPAVGLELVAYAAAHATLPFFAIGGIDTDNVGEVVEAGARRICVVRAIRDADEPDRRRPTTCGGPSPRSASEVAPGG